MKLSTVIVGVIAAIVVVYLVLFRSTPKDTEAVAAVASGISSDAASKTAETVDYTTPTEQSGGAQLNESVPSVVNYPVQPVKPVTVPIISLGSATTIAANLNPTLASLERDEYGRFVYEGTIAEQAAQQEALQKVTFVTHPDVADWAQGLTYDSYRSELAEQTRVQTERQKLPQSQLIYWNLRNWVGAPAIYQYGGLA
jgi:hypothetical protein